MHLVCIDGPCLDTPSSKAIKTREASRNELRKLRFHSFLTFWERTGCWEEPRRFFFHLSSLHIGKKIVDAIVPPRIVSLFSVFQIRRWNWTKMTGEKKTRWKFDDFQYFIGWKRGKNRRLDESFNRAWFSPFASRTTLPTQMGSKMAKKPREYRCVKYQKNTKGGDKCVFGEL